MANYTSTWFRVTDQILLEYRSRQKDIVLSTTGQSDDPQPGRFYIYRGWGGDLYYTEDFRYTSETAKDKSWFKNQGLYLKFPTQLSDYAYVKPGQKTVSDLMKYQSSELIDYATRVRNLAVSNPPQDTEPHIEMTSNFFYDEIRIYFISGYAMDGLDGITLKVSSDAIHEIIEDGASHKESSEVFIIDAYIDKSMLYPKMAADGTLSASPFHLLDIPMYMNSRFYDKYISIEFPSLYGIAVRDHNIYDENSDQIMNNDPTFVVMYYNEDGSLNTGQSEIYSVNLDGSTIVEFGTVSESKNGTAKVQSDNVKTVRFDINPNPVRGNVIDQPNSEYFNARLYTDSDNGDIIYVPVYGDSEFTTDVYGQFMRGELRLDANAFYDAETSYLTFNDIDKGGDPFYYADKEQQLKNEKPKLTIFCELLASYLYYDFDGSVKVYEESYAREIDYERNMNSGIEFWKSRYRPDANIIQKTRAQKISIQFTCHLKNELRGSETIRTASMLVDTKQYTQNRLKYLNINTYKIIHKVDSGQKEVVVNTTEPYRERYIRTYYNATNLAAKNVGTGATVYSQGQMTLYLNKTGSVYGIQLYNINNDNVRVPYDLTGTYKYKLVVSTPDGTTSIKPNQESDKRNMGIGQLFFYISGDVAQSIMNVPEEKRYFAITTDLTGRATSQETVLYEGKVDWLS